MEFDWNHPRSIQVKMGNSVETQKLSPKQVIATGGNRIQVDQLIASLCVAVTELIKIQEETAVRINTMYEQRSKDVAREPKATEPGHEL